MTVENKKPGGAFDLLLTELTTLAKAMPAPEPEPDEDEKIRLAAEAEAAAGGEKKVAPAPLAKSMQVTLADGTIVDAEDGTELVKSLIDRLDGTESVMAKALGGAVELIKAQGVALASTTALVKSLQSKVAELSNAPAGRKAVLSVHEKPAGDLTKSQPEGLTHVEFMAKSHSAFDAKKISGQELTVIDVSLRQGHPIEPSLISKVLA